MIWRVPDTPPVLVWKKALKCAEDKPAWDLLVYCAPEREYCPDRKCTACSATRMVWSAVHATVVVTEIDILSTRPGHIDDFYRLHKAAIDAAKVKVLQEGVELMPRRRRGE